MLWRSLGEKLCGEGRDCQTHESEGKERLMYGISEKKLKGKTDQGAFRKKPKGIIYSKLMTYTRFFHF